VYLLRPLLELLKRQPISPSSRCRTPTYYSESHPTFLKCEDAMDRTTMRTTPLVVFPPRHITIDSTLMHFRTTSRKIL